MTETIRYFAIFRHPLRVLEIHAYLSVRATVEEVRVALGELEKEGGVMQSGEFFMPPDSKGWVVERLAGSRRAVRLLEKSGRGTEIIARCPFVDGIAISGSLSKWYAGENGDIDYFIITRRNRLWIARTLLHLFKKLTFITGHQHYFCMNYFVDKKALTITHQNLYTAVEIATLMPVYNPGLFKQMKAENTWTRELLPNHSMEGSGTYTIGKSTSLPKKLFEGIFNMLFPRYVNRKLMQLTAWKWKRKWRHNGYSPEAYKKAFMTTPHISKNHPNDYEEKVLKELQM